MNDVEEKKRQLALKDQQEEERRLKIEKEKLNKIDEAKRFVHIMKYIY